MKRGTIDHPKMRRLGRELGLPLYAAVGLLECLWHFTAERAPRGDIGRWDDEDIAEACGWPMEEAARLIAALVRTGWLDEHAEHRLVVHDWSEHADDAIHVRLSRNGESFADGAAPRQSRLARRERTTAESAHCAHKSAQQRTTAHKSAQKRTLCNTEPPAGLNAANIRKCDEASSRNAENDHTATNNQQVAEDFVRTKAHKSAQQRTTAHKSAQKRTLCALPEPVPVPVPVSGGVQELPYTPLPPNGSSPPPPLAHAPVEISAAAEQQRVERLEIDVAGRMLRDWMGHHADRLPPPDDALCRRLLACCGGLDGMHAWLRGLQRRGKRPESVQQWGWFVTLAETETSAGAAGGNAA